MPQVSIYHHCHLLRWRKNAIPSDFSCRWGCLPRCWRLARWARWLAAPTDNTWRELTRRGSHGVLHTSRCYYIGVHGEAVRNHGQLEGRKDGAIKVSTLGTCWSVALSTNGRGNLIGWGHVTQKLRTHAGYIKRASWADFRGDMDC